MPNKCNILRQVSACPCPSAPSCATPAPALASNNDALALSFAPNNDAPGGQDPDEGALAKSATSETLTLPDWFLYLHSHLNTLTLIVDEAIVAVAEKIWHLLHLTQLYNGIVKIISNLGDPL